MSIELRRFDRFFPLGFNIYHPIGPADSPEDMLTVVSPATLGMAGRFTERYNLIEAGVCSCPTGCATSVRTPRLTAGQGWRRARRARRAG